MQRDLPCAYHQGQVITNFCDDPHCLMPLCPKCLSIHTGEHKKNKTYGSFQSIDDIIQKASQISKQKIEQYRILMSKNEKSTQSNSDLNVTLLRKIKEAKERINFEIDSFFNALESKCKKMCQEFSLKKTSSLMNDTIDLEKKIRQYQEHLEGIQKKDKCLMSIIRIFKNEQEDQIAGNFGSLNSLNPQNEISSSENGGLLKKMQLKVDLEKLTEITDSLSGYAKLVYNQTKKHVKFDDNSVSNKSLNSSVDSRPSPLINKNQIESPQQDKIKKVNKMGNSVYQREDEQEDQDDSYENQEQTENKKKGFYKDADDIYLVNDPDIIRLKQRREESRIKAELREIGKRKPQSSQNQSNNNQPTASSKIRKPPSSSIIDDLESGKTRDPSSSNFITFEKPSKDQLKQFAKPEELEFLEKVQKKSIQMQQDFERQQNEILLSAMNYTIPVPNNRQLYQPRQFPEQQQQQQQQQQAYQSQKEISSPLQPALKKHSMSQPDIDITSPQNRQNLQQQYHAQQSFALRSPLADKFNQNNYNKPSITQHLNSGFENSMNQYSSQNQPMSSYQSPNKSINSQFKFDMLNNSHSQQQQQQQQQQQWTSQNRFMN